MNDHSDNVEGSFSYTVTATANGGATGTATGTADLMIACTGAAVTTFDKTESFEIPETSYTTYSWPTASSNYVSLDSLSGYLSGPSLSCSQSFSYVMKDGSLNPSELTIGSSSGEFSLDAYYNSKTTYVVEITVTTTDGYNPVSITIPDFTISTVCGTSSTTLTVPSVISDLYRIPNYPHPLTATDAFTSSNTVCDVVTNTLT
jgi:hypothetical protein